MKTKFSGILTLLLVLVVQLSFAQQKTVTGTVNDDAGLPLPGANVIVKGTSNGTQTDFDGNYSISVNQGQTLVFSYVGFDTQEIEVGASNSINVNLLLGSSLGEIVITGYGTQTKEKVITSVSVVGEEAIEDLVVFSPDQLLQGQASGVQVVNNSGLLGAASAVRVRGVGTINGGNSPLFILDGVPLQDNANNFANGGNQASNPLSTINPNDIESLTVLKDAAATAPYGTRGANGVIIITTKKGKKNQGAQVTVNNWVQFSELTDVFDMMTGDQYREFKSTIATIQNDGEFVPSEDLGLGAIGDPSVDYIDEVTRTGVTQNYDVSVRGGSEKTTYFIGGTYQDAESFSIGNNQERLSSRVNLTTEANDWLTAGMNVGITNTRLRQNSVENSVLAPITSAQLQNPTQAIFDENGEFIPSPTFIPNIVQVTALNRNITSTLRTIGNAFLEVKLAEGLTFRPEFGTDVSNLTVETRSPVEVPFGDNATLLDINERLFKITNALTYQTVFGENHNFSALALVEYEERIRRLTQITGTEFLSGDITNVGGATTQVVDAASEAESRLFGILASARYDYDGKYLLEASGRRDGSSRFGADNRFAYFYAASAGWVISRESFLEDSETINYLALRGSYGTAGNDRIGNFPSLGLNEPGRYDAVPTLEILSASNANLGWETSTTLDLGIKSSLFNNRLDVNVTYFNKETSDLLLNQILPRQAGQGSITSNVGALRNFGVELDINSVNVRNDNFQWTTNLAVATIQNELLELNEEADVDDQGRRFLQSGAQRAIVGESLSTFFLIRYNGINPETGDAEWLDRDGNVTLEPTTDDRVEVGSALPDFSGGITNTFKYKNWDLSVFANFSVGNDILVDGLQFVDGNDAIGGIGNVRAVNGNIWQQPGDIAFLPSPNSTTFNLFNQQSTRNLFDASYLRIKNITLGYRFPDEMFKNSNTFSGIRLYATTTNIATIKSSDLEGIDPEVNDSGNPLRQGETFFTAPQAISYVFGASFQF